MDNSQMVEKLLQKLFITLEVSGRHVHLTQQQARALFGHDLTPERELSQPGQFLARERVQLMGPKGSFSNVAVLGPARKEGQVEISLTDGRVLGITPPIRASGDVAGSPGIGLRGPAGQVQLKQGVIAAQRHLHLTPEDGARFGVRDKELVRLQVFTGRPLIFEDVLVRISPEFASRAHLDTDEANACGLKTGDLGRILPCSKPC